MQKEKGERVGISGTTRAPCFLGLSTFPPSLGPSLEASAEERTFNNEYFKEQQFYFHYLRIYIIHRSTLTLLLQY